MTDIIHNPEVAPEDAAITIRPALSRAWVSAEETDEGSNEDLGRAAAAVAGTNTGKMFVRPAEETAEARQHPIDRAVHFLDMRSQTNAARELAAYRDQMVAELTRQQESRDNMAASLHRFATSVALALNLEEGASNEEILEALQDALRPEEVPQPLISTNPPVSLEFHNHVLKELESLRKSVTDTRQAFELLKGPTFDLTPSGLPRAVRDILTANNKLRERNTLLEERDEGRKEEFLDLCELALGSRPEDAAAARLQEFITNALQVRPITADHEQAWQTLLQRNERLEQALETVTQIVRLAK